MAVRLSKRMEALAHLVTPGSRLCDVGCDHGYLPIYLVQQIIPSAIAMDIGEGPLSAAKTHIAEVGLEDKIQTRRSDGLAAASAEEIDTILIAGMGGGIVIHILTEGRRVAQSVKDLILQPQSELKEVRRFLCNEGYEIVDEDMVLEDGKYYPMMKVRYVPETKDRRQSVAEHDFLFGPMLLQAPGLTCLSAPGGADPKRGLGASGRTKADTCDRKEDAGSAGIFAGDTKVSVVNRRNKR